MNFDVIKLFLISRFLLDYQYLGAHKALLYFAFTPSHPHILFTPVLNHIPLLKVHMS